MQMERGQDKINNFGKILCFFNSISMKKGYNVQQNYVILMNGIGWDNRIKVHDDIHKRSN